MARHFTEHEFLFITHGDGARVIGAEFEVVEIINPETPVVNHQVNAWGALVSNIRVRRQSGRHMARLNEIAASFRPDLTLTDYEYFVPKLAGQHGLPCLSLDHQHVVTATRCEFPLLQFPAYLATSLAVKRYFSRADFFIATSFYQPPLKKGDHTVLTPPLLRNKVLEIHPGEGDHVLAYHGYQTFNQFFDFLKQVPGKVIVYGSNTCRVDQNLQYKRNAESEFLEDLATCRYVICGAGHTLISEALFLGKPLLVFPIKGAFEQFLNAYYLQMLGYGRFCTDFRPSPQLIRDFEADTERYRFQIRKGTFAGNDEVFDHLDHYFRHGNPRRPGDGSLLKRS